MRHLIVSGLLLVASIASLALLPDYVVTNLQFREKFWVIHLHLNNVVFVVLLAAAALVLIFSRLEIALRSW